ncbi:WD repeat-containing protein 26 homolog [Olea europaea var. sylvestris]|uniref:WD repeat-containing protein 26 homolog n=1 Tax=Olea europaea var. sylvestris TaxID=158386 RepID=UPI000C1CE03B|nr:WD repeat-containing protein 26 homolog [Olea europaea var. sylvestris]
MPLISKIFEFFLLHDLGAVNGGGIFNLRNSKNGDPEPGRCKRTDGKKWRCSKKVASNQKYCQRHLHSRPGSRKLVEVKNNASINTNMQATSAPTDQILASNKTPLLYYPRTDLNNSLASYKESNRLVFEWQLACVKSSVSLDTHDFGVVDGGSPGYDGGGLEVPMVPLLVTCGYGEVVYVWLSMLGMVQLQILQEHSDEVWFLQFSHNGKYLASSSSDCLVIIWEVKLDGRVSLKHRLSGHQKPVSCISWSPDDQQLLTCGVEDAMRRWDVTSGECLHIYGKNGLGFVSCGWAPDGKRIFSGVTDKSISMWDLEGREVECWKGQRTIRISDLGITRDGKELITVCKETTILLFGWESQSEKLIEESQNIVSFTLSEDSKFLLVSLSNQEIHLWNIDDDINLVAKFKGHKRSRFVLKSCFGGLHQAFIASGSEDSKVYIWHRVSGELVLTLSGHSGAVNCVSWNPANPHMLASASDDRTIRIWGLNRVCLNHDDKHSNGTYHCNGGT